MSKTTMIYTHVPEQGTAGGEQPVRISVNQNETMLAVPINARACKTQTREKSVRSGFPAIEDQDECLRLVRSTDKERLPDPLIKR